mgnify:CR=1 FL=1
MDNSSLQAVTFTNSGYLDYTHNLIESINKNKTLTNLEVVVIDEESDSYFKKIHDNVSFFKTNYVQKKNDIWKQDDEDFGNLMMTKFEVIYQSLCKYEKVLYLDGDIVIKRNFDKALNNFLGNNDIIFQNDRRPSKPNEIKICAGFMYIHSNEKTRNFFNPENVPFKKVVSYKAHDQTYITKSKNKFNHSILPMALFPNGPYFYEHHKNLDPYIVHFNFLIGHNKKDKMKEMGEWYLND